MDGPTFSTGDKLPTATVINSTFRRWQLLGSTVHTECPSVHPLKFTLYTCISLSKVTYYVMEKTQH